MGSGVGGGVRESDLFIVSSGNCIFYEMCGFWGDFCGIVSRVYVILSSYLIVLFRFFDFSRSHPPSFPPPSFPSPPPTTLGDHRNNRFPPLAILAAALPCTPRPTLTPPTPAPHPSPARLYLLNASRRCWGSKGPKSFSFLAFGFSNERLPVLAPEAKMSSSSFSMLTKVDEEAGRSGEKRRDWEGTEARDGGGEGVEEGEAC